MLRANRRLAPAFAVACFLAGSTLLPAQSPLFPRDGQERELDAAPFVLEAKTLDRFTDLREGRKALADDLEANRALLARAARWYTYRLTDPKHQAIEPVLIKEGHRKELPGMNQLVRDAHAQLLIGKALRKEPQDQTNQLEFRQAFGKELVKSVREVLAVSTRPIVRVNAVRVLAGVAETGNEDAADTLAEIVQGGAESDGVKHGAIVGLEHLFAQGRAEKSIFQDPKREARCIRVLLDHVTRQVEAPAEPAQRDALCFVRRTAIRALGQTRHATIPGSEGMDGQTAGWLLRIARGEGLAPEPSPAERVEAAIGACYLCGKTDKDLHLDCIAHQVGVVAVEFARQANKQRAGTTDQYVPCLKSAARLYRGLDALNARARAGGDKEVAGLVDQVTQRAQPLLLQAGQGQATDPLALGDWLESHPPKHKAVYPDSTKSRLRTTP